MREVPTEPDPSYHRIELNEPERLYAPYQYGEGSQASPETWQETLLHHQREVSVATIKFPIGQSGGGADHNSESNCKVAVELGTEGAGKEADQSIQVLNLDSGQVVQEPGISKEKCDIPTERKSEESASSQQKQSQNPQDGQSLSTSVAYFSSDSESDCDNEQFLHILEQLPQYPDQKKT